MPDQPDFRFPPATEIRLVTRTVGTKQVVTSPDVPELHCSADTVEEALAAVPSALEMFARMKRRAIAKQRLVGPPAAPRH